MDVFSQGLPGLAGPVGVDGIPGLPGQKGEKVWEYLKDFHMPFFTFSSGIKAILSKNFLQLAQDS